MKTDSSCQKVPSNKTSLAFPTLREVQTSPAEQNLFQSSHISPTGSHQHPLSRNEGPSLLVCFPRRFLLVKKFCSSKKTILYLAGKCVFLVFTSLQTLVYSCSSHNWQRHGWIRFVFCAGLFQYKLKWKERLNFMANGFENINKHSEWQNTFHTVIGGLFFSLQGLLPSWPVSLYIMNYNPNLYASEYHFLIKTVPVAGSLHWIALDCAGVHIIMSILFRCQFQINI